MGYKLARDRKYTNYHTDFLPTLKIEETDTEYSVINGDIVLSKNKIDNFYHLHLIDGFININEEEMKGLRGTETSIINRLKGNPDQFLLRTAQQLFSQFRKNFEQ